MTGGRARCARNAMSQRWRLGSSRLRTSAWESLLSSHGQAAGKCAKPRVFNRALGTGNRGPSTPSDRPGSKEPDRSRQQPIRKDEQFSEEQIRALREWRTNGDGTSPRPRFPSKKTTPFTGPRKPAVEKTPFDNFFVADFADILRSLNLPGSIPYLDAPTTTPSPYAYHEEDTVTIIATSDSGHGAAVGKDNWIVLVHGGLEGERVRVKIYRDGAGFSMADLLEVLETSPIRVEPRCKHFKECSVCTFQHVTYEEQLRRKHGVVKRAFDSLWKPPTIIDADGNAKPVDTDAPVKVVKVQDVIPSPLQYGYRTKMTPHYPRRAAYQPLEKIGFNGRGSKSVVDIEECPIVTKEIEDDFKALRRELIGSTSPGFANGSTLSFRHSLVLPKLHPVQQYSGDRRRPLAPLSDPIPWPTPALSAQSVRHSKLPVVDCVNNVKFTFPAHSFFQNNSSILPEMTTYIRKCLRDTISAFGVNVLVDAYCGSGLFALSCAPDFEKVVGIEIDSKALDAASKNALNNSIGNAIFIKGSAERIYDEAFEPEAQFGRTLGSRSRDGSPKLRRDPSHTAVIMDPPSKGAGEDFMQQLRQFNPKVIVYVSCNVHSQTRDLASLLRRVNAQVKPKQPSSLRKSSTDSQTLRIGGKVIRLNELHQPAGHLRSIIRSEPKLYDIIHVQPFDMFPQTAQVENIAILVRRD